MHKQIDILYQLKNQLQLQFLFIINQMIQILIFGNPMADQCIAHITKRIPEVLMYSGRYFMRLGNYRDCIQSPGMDFNNIYFTELGNSIAMLYASLCLPVSCTSQIIATTIDAYAQSLGLPIRVSFINNKIPGQSYPYDWLFYFSVLLLSVLVLLVVASTLVPKLSGHKLVGAFSIKNSAKIFKYNPNSRLNVLNGVRSLAMLYVIWGHQNSMVIINTSNILSINDILASWFQLVIQAGIFAVDVFFFVGGFLVAYSILKQDKVKSRLKYPLAILNRFLRFVPSYFVAILLYYSIMPHLVSGPFYYQMPPTVQNCGRMWKTLLFVDNLVDNGEKQCMGWGWYLQNDMQIFLFSLLIMLIYTKSRFWAFITIFMSTALSCAYTMQQSFDRQYKNTTHMDDFTNYGDYMSRLYVKPWSRCPPYLVGLLLGILYIQFLISEKQSQERKPIPIQVDLDHQSHQQLIDKHRRGHPLLQLKHFFIENPWRRRLFQFSGVLIACFVMLIPRTAQGDDHHWPQLAHSLYLTYAKLLYVLGIAMIILPSLLGANTFVRFILDTKIFNFIAKISFWTYLVHLTIMEQWIYSIKNQFYFAYVPLYGLFLTTTVESMTVAFLFCLLVEIPFAKLQKEFINAVLLKRSAKSRHPRLEKQNENNPQQKLSNTTQMQSANSINQPMIPIKIKSISVEISH